MLLELYWLIKKVDKVVIIIVVVDGLIFINFAVSYLRLTGSAM